MDATDRLFGEIAVKLGHLSREQLADCIRTQYDSPAGTTLGQIALTLGFMQQAEVEHVLAQQGRLTDQRRTKSRTDIVEIDATHSSSSERNERNSSRAASSRPEGAARNQARAAKTQPNQPPVAAAYRSPSSAKVPSFGAAPISHAPAIEPKQNEPKPESGQGARPSRRADRTLIGTAPGQDESSPAHEAITVIPPPGHHDEATESDLSVDPEVSFESLTSSAPSAAPVSPLPEPTVIDRRTHSTPPEASFAGLDDPEVSFGAVLSQAPKAPTRPASSAGAGTIHGVGAPQPPAAPLRAETPARPRSGTLAFAAPALPAEIVAAKAALETRTKRSGTMQFRGVTPAQPDDLAPPASPDPSPTPERAQARAEARRSATSLSPNGPAATRNATRSPRRASAWFSSLPALASTGVNHSPSLPTRATTAALDLKDPALAQVPAGTDGLLLRAMRVALEHGAYDIHFHHAAPIMMRLHGHLQPLLGGAALGTNAVEKTLAQVMSDGQWRRLSERGEVMFSIDIPDTGRARISAYRGEGGCGAVARLAPAQPRTLSDLGLPTSLAKLLEYESGLIVCTGPIGNGVTTTLGALVGGVVTARQAHVVTLEDLIELRMPNTRCLVSQRQLGTHVNDLARGLRAVAHEDADLIAIGDLRNAEDIALALSLAHGGHLVVAGAHASSAADCLNHLIHPFGKSDQQQARRMLAQTLRAVVTQHLVMRADGQGRVPAIELIVATPAVSELIRRGASIDIASLTQSGKAQKLVTLGDSLQRLVTAGTVTAEEAERVARNQQMLD